MSFNRYGEPDSTEIKMSRTAEYANMNFREISMIQALDNLSTTNIGATSEHSLFDLRYNDRITSKNQTEYNAAFEHSLVGCSFGKAGDNDKYFPISSSVTTNPLANDNATTGNWETAPVSFDGVEFYSPRYFWHVASNDGQSSGVPVVNKNEVVAGFDSEVGGSSVDYIDSLSSGLSKNSNFQSKLWSTLGGIGATSFGDNLEFTQTRKLGNIGGAQIYSDDVGTMQFSYSVGRRYENWQSSPETYENGAFVSYNNKAYRWDGPSGGAQGIPESDPNWTQVNFAKIVVTLGWALERGNGTDGGWSEIIYYEVDQFAIDIGIAGGYTFDLSSRPLGKQKMLIEGSDLEDKMYQRRSGIGTPSNPLITEQTLTAVIQISCHTSDIDP